MVDIAEAAQRKIGPLPAWAWGAVVGGGLLIYRVATGGGGGASSPFVQPIAGGSDFDVGTGGGSGGGTVTPPAPTPDRLRVLYDAALAKYKAGTGPNPGTFARFTERLNYPLPTTTPTPTTPSPSQTGGTPLVPGGSTRGAPPSPTDRLAWARYSRGAGTGDTGATPPLFGALGGNGAVVLGLPQRRAEAVDAAGAMARATFLQDAPAIPSYPIAIPGTLIAPSPPIITAQGETAARRAIPTPRAIVVGLQGAARRGRIPTTRRLGLPRFDDGTLERFRPYKPTG